MEVKYKTQPIVSNISEVRSIDFTITVVPDQEAELPGGKSNVIQFIEKKALQDIMDSNSFERAIISFEINEEGKVNRLHVVESSGLDQTDKALLDAISQMPPWKPAVNANRTRVVQKFMVMIGNNIGC